MKIMVFLHGTVIMQKAGINHTPQERSQQVKDGEASVHDLASYVSIDNAVAKLHSWQTQGAEILYLTFHKDAEGLRHDKRVLRKHEFPVGPVLFRRSQEGYNDVVERVLPDILIEDDCESIGGESQMAYPRMKEEIKSRIKSIVVTEFAGIDHLPDALSDLEEL